MQFRTNEISFRINCNISWHSWNSINATHHSCTHLASPIIVARLCVPCWVRFINAKSSLLISQLVLWSRKSMANFHFLSFQEANKSDLSTLWRCLCDDDDNGTTTTMSGNTTGEVIQSSFSGPKTRDDTRTNESLQLFIFFGRIEWVSSMSSGQISPSKCVCVFLLVYSQECTQQIDHVKKRNCVSTVIEHFGNAFSLMGQTT